jgi:hypothetical protein
MIPGGEVFKSMTRLGGFVNVVNAKNDGEVDEFGISSELPKGLVFDAAS